MNRRVFIGSASVGLAQLARGQSVPESIRNLKPMLDGIQPITTGERRARIEFGAPLKVREQCQDVSGRNTLESLAQDLRFSLRILRKAPGFTLVAVGTLALAIGANTVVFAALNAVILRPLDVARPEPQRVEAAK